MLAKLLLYLTAMVVIFPTTLVALFGSMLGIPYLFSMKSSELPAAIILFLSTTLGWLGIYSLWKLFFHFKAGKAESLSSRLYLAGLLGGGSVSAYLILYSGGTLLFRLGFFGLPLIGVVVMVGFWLFKKN